MQDAKPQTTPIKVTQRMIWAHDGHEVALEVEGTDLSDVRRRILFLAKEFGYQRRKWWQWWRWGELDYEKIFERTQ